MSIVVRFMPTGLTKAKYDECIKRLEQAGADSPAGRLYHVCFGDENNLRVSDIWETREALDKFGEILRPILEDVGVGSDENPEAFEVYNIIEKPQAGTARP